MERADLVLFRSTSLMGGLVRWAERTKGEEASWANHAGMIVTDGPIQDAVLIESNWLTEKRPLLANHLDDEISVYRYTAMTEEQRSRAVAKMHEFVGDKYGWPRLLAHAVDNHLLGGSVILRWLGRKKENSPICSYSTGLSYESAGIGFGLPAWAAQPDDMDDWCLVHPSSWERVIFRIKGKDI